MTREDGKVITEAVARALRQQRRRRMTLASAAVVILVIALLLIRCGGGFGVGGGDGALGSGAGTGAQRAVAPTAADAGVRCQVRVDATGVTVGGAPASPAEVVTACKGTSGADVLVTGDARQGTWDELRAALVAAGVQMAVQGAGAEPPGEADR